MKNIRILMTIGLVAGALTLAAKPSTLDLTAQVGKGAKTFQLRGKHSRQQLVATATEAAKLSDVSRKVKYSATPAKVVAINATGMVTPLGDGEATITAMHAGGLKASYDLGLLGMFVGHERRQVEKKRQYRGGQERDEEQPRP